MTFPDSPRVLYKNNPLEEVICQLRFPPVLRIGAEAPAAFQDRIRGEYPLFREKRHPEFSKQLPQEIAKMLAAETPFRFREVSYDFLSSDEAWTIGLTKEFLALATTRYQKWEEFREKLKYGVEALIEEYSPAFFSRIGLRYRDLVRRSKLNLTGCEWSSLLKHPIVGELATPEIAQKVDQSFHNVLIRLDINDSFVRVRHGLAIVGDERDPCYIIDADFFTDQPTEARNATKLLDEFNREAGRLFRWCITDQLHNAMEPETI